MVWAGAIAVPVLVIAAAAWWVRFAFVAITVEGFSMSPTLRPGDRVLIRRGRRSLRRDRIVVIARPDHVDGWRNAKPAGRDLTATHWYIKRAVALAGDPYPPQMDREGIVPDGHMLVIGDHPHSEDSKRHGPCPENQILGVVVRHFATPDAKLAAEFADVDPDQPGRIVQVPESITVGEDGRLNLPEGFTAELTDEQLEQVRDRLDGADDGRPDQGVTPRLEPGDELPKRLD